MGEQPLRVGAGTAAGRVRRVRRARRSGRPRPEWGQGQYRPHRRHHRCPGVADRHRRRPDFFLGGDDEEPVASGTDTTSESATSTTSSTTSTPTSTPREPSSEVSTTPSTPADDGEFSAPPGYFGTGLDVSHSCEAPTGVKWVGAASSLATCVTAEEVASDLVGHSLDDVPVSITAYDDLLEKDVDFTCEETTDGDGDALFECKTDGDLDTVYVYL